MLDLSTVDPRGLSAGPTKLAATRSRSSLCPRHIEAPEFWLKLSELQDATVEGWPDPIRAGPWIECPSMIWCTCSCRPQAAAGVLRRATRRRARRIQRARRPARARRSAVQGDSRAADCRNRGVATALRRGVSRSRGRRHLHGTEHFGHPAMVRMNGTFGFQKSTVRFVLSGAWRRTKCARGDRDIRSNAPHYVIRRSLQGERRRVLVRVTHASTASGVPTVCPQTNGPAVCRAVDPCI